MCGGYTGEHEEMKGPQWKFERAEDFHRAVEVCKRKVPADSWRVTDDNTITFASIRAEEIYSIAKAAAGSGGL